MEKEKFYYKDKDIVITPCQNCGGVICFLRHTKNLNEKIERKMYRKLMEYNHFYNGGAPSYIDDSQKDCIDNFHMHLFPL